MFGSPASFCKPHCICYGTLWPTQHISVNDEIVSPSRAASLAWLACHTCTRRMPRGADSIRQHKPCLSQQAAPKFLHKLAAEPPATPLGCFAARVQVRSSCRVETVPIKGPDKAEHDQNLGHRTEQPDKHNIFNVQHANVQCTCACASAPA
jgi:hypothetical protein